MSKKTDDQNIPHPLPYPLYPNTIRVKLKTDFRTPSAVLLSQVQQQSCSSQLQVRYSSLDDYCVQFTRFKRAAQRARMAKNGTKTLEAPHGRISSGNLYIYGVLDIKIG